MKYLQTFRVHGSSRFPVDMLRYDSCWPASEDYSIEISDSCGLGDKRMVKLCRWVESKTALPTVGRWESFGWKVEMNSIVTMKP